MEKVRAIVDSLPQPSQEGWCRAGTGSPDPGAGPHRPVLPLRPGLPERGRGPPYAVKKYRRSRPPWSRPSPLSGPALSGASSTSSCAR